ncbi:hypothetical protein ENBRE01_2736 [Enteropsectra breve]|nr:hypothetical protein ENBRE01_2736 [Enteropsectra breve]
MDAEFAKLLLIETAQLWDARDTVCDLFKKCVFVTDIPNAIERLEYLERCAEKARIERDERKKQHLLHQQRNKQQFNIKLSKARIIIPAKNGNASNRY